MAKAVAMSGAVRGSNSERKVSWFCLHCSSQMTLVASRRATFTCEKCPANGGRDKRCVKALTSATGTKVVTVSDAVKIEAAQVVGKSIGSREKGELSTGMLEDDEMTDDEHTVELSQGDAIAEAGFDVEDGTNAEITDEDAEVPHLSTVQNKCKSKRNARRSATSSIDPRKASSSQNAVAKKVSRKAGGAKGRNAKSNSSAGSHSQSTMMQVAPKSAEAWESLCALAAAGKQLEDIKPDPVANGVSQGPLSINSSQPPNIKSGSSSAISEQSCDGIPQTAPFASNDELRQVTFGYNGRTEMNCEIGLNGEQDSISGAPRKGRGNKIKTEEEREAKRVRRIQANRESARNTIRRKKAQYEDLAKRVQSLEAENSDLISQRDEALYSWRMLSMQTHRMREEVRLCSETASTDSTQLLTGSTSHSHVEPQPQPQILGVEGHFAAPPGAAASYTWNSGFQRFPGPPAAAQYHGSYGLASRQVPSYHHQQFTQHQEGPHQTSHLSHLQPQHLTQQLHAHLSQHGTSLPQHHTHQQHVQQQHHPPPSQHSQPLHQSLQQQAAATGPSLDSFPGIVDVQSRPSAVHAPAVTIAANMPPVWSWQPPSQTMSSFAYPVVHVGTETISS
ncbi:hypothetical protein CYMTET_6908 [Cymbomonas tetramitiformis]|uniref:BZIP domain-containing protein n=1 Tax=Cymbomonas tetramitiformis TaxID=36881 RepID=A0AAE0GWH9_9CHLO|nr:hypothetical protein CYMTET_6908 [Cymbomonas tetramitiformis]